METAQISPTNEPTALYRPSKEEEIELHLRNTEQAIHIIGNQLTVPVKDSLLIGNCLNTLGNLLDFLYKNKEVFKADESDPKALEGSTKDNQGNKGVQGDQAKGTAKT